MRTRECIHCVKIFDCKGTETKRCVNFEPDEDYQSKHKAKDEED